MTGEKIMDDIILISGGFDPIHSGHIKLITEASKHGNVVVLLNSDEWLRNKKGKEFLPIEERKIRRIHQKANHKRKSEIKKINRKSNLIISNRFHKFDCIIYIRSSFN